MVSGSNHLVGWWHGCISQKTIMIWSVMCLPKKMWRKSFNDHIITKKLNIKTFLRSYNPCIMKNNPSSKRKINKIDKYNYNEKKYYNNKNNKKNTIKNKYNQKKHQNPNLELKKKCLSSQPRSAGKAPLPSSSSSGSPGVRPKKKLVLQ